MVDATFQHPTTILVAGSTGSGKTHLTCELVRKKHIVFSNTPHVVILMYKEMQPAYTKLKNEGFIDLFHEGQPENMEALKSLLREYPPDARKLLILDDLMMETGELVSELFTRISHHMNTSVIYLTQNLFFQKKGFRDISLNAHYLILMKNARDQSQISTLAKQIKPHYSSFITKVYANATKEKHSYLLLDCHPAQLGGFICLASVEI